LKHFLSVVVLRENHLLRRSRDGDAGHVLDAETKFAVLDFNNLDRAEGRFDGGIRLGARMRRAD